MSALLANWKAVAAGLVLAALVSALGVQTVRLAEANTQIAEGRADLASYKTAAAETTALALRAQLQHMERIHNDQRKALDEAATETRAAQADRDTARESSASLQRQVTRFAAAARTALARAAALERSTAGADPIGVLADVLGWCDARAGRLAEIADRARIAGKLCERSYDALTPK